MRVQKRFLGVIDKVYATAIMELRGEINYLVASEGTGPCVAINGKNWTQDNIWTAPGGTQNIVPLPGTHDQFIATQEFFSPGFQAKECKLVHAVLRDGCKWSVRALMTIPYLHRFDIFVLSGKRYLIGATLCEAKSFTDDWSKPGTVYVGEIPPDVDGSFRLTPILEGVTKNHGFSRGSWKGREAYLISGVEGVFVLYLPSKVDDKWEIEQILHHEVSDIATYDINGDGCEELATIEPFHGNRSVIYQRAGNKLVSIHEYGYEFGHVVWGGEILGRPGFITGGRRGSRELNWFQPGDNGKLVQFTIDNTGGPSTIKVINHASSSKILAANRELGEAALYEITP